MVAARWPCPSVLWRRRNSWAADVTERRRRDGRGGVSQPRSRREVAVVDVAAAQRSVRVHRADRAEVPLGRPGGQAPPVAEHAEEAPLARAANADEGRVCGPRAVGPPVHCANAAHLVDLLV